MFDLRNTGRVVGGLILIGVLALAVGCSDDDTPFRPTPGPETSTWKAVNPFPAGNNLNGICGDGQGGLFVVGNAGTALHLRQSEWSSGDLPEETALWDVCANSPDDAWAYTSWGGGIYHYDGRSWTMHTRSAQAWGIWSGGPDHLFIVTAFEIYEFDGTFWTEHSYPLPPCPDGHTCMSPHLMGIWGADLDDVYVWGTGEFLIHYDGVSWDQVDYGVGANVNEVWGSAPDDVFAVGDEGTIIHYDGLAWEPQASGSAQTLIDIWGSGPEDVYALGDADTVLFYDGDSWSPLPVDIVDELHGLLGTEATLNGIGGTGPGAVYVIGGAGTLLSYDGTSWVPYSDDTRQDFTDIWGCSETDMWLAGADGVSRFDGLTVGETEALPIIGLWGTACDDVVGVGAGVFRFDGTAWATELISETDTLTAVWGRATDDIFAVGLKGLIRHYDGNSWQEESSPVGTRLRGVWGSPEAEGDVFAVGKSGMIRRRADSGWSVEETGTETDLYSVWGSSATNVYAGGRDVLLHYDGTDWTRLDNPEEVTHAYYLHIWGSGAGDVFAGGLGTFNSIVDVRGIIRHFDGAYWTEEPTGVQNPPCCIWGHDGGSVYAVGIGGTILKRSGRGW